MTVWGRRMGMGYSTEFTGRLNFKTEPTAKQLAGLNDLLGADVREIDPTYQRPPGLYYLQFELTDDFCGIKWDGGEKFTGSVDAVNYITEKMRERWPDFAFTGWLMCQGEDVEDRWKLMVEDGVARRVDDPPTGRKVTCPHCEREFRLDEGADQ